MMQPIDRSGSNSGPSAIIQPIDRSGSNSGPSAMMQPSALPLHHDHCHISCILLCDSGPYFKVTFNCYLFD